MNVRDAKSFSEQQKVNGKTNCFASLVIMNSTLVLGGVQNQTTIAERRETDNR